MLRLTALVHTHNDSLRLGRCLETVYSCDEIVIVDHGSTDRTLQVAREYGARIVTGKSEEPRDEFPDLGREWILCLDPRESLTENLAASLFEWKLASFEFKAVPFCVSIREETPHGWSLNAAAQTRLVPTGWQRWEGHLPANEPEARILEGELLRFDFP
jgi:glycosyltransferase involved in cell wall biosynthesis